MWAWVVLVHVIGWDLDIQSTVRDTVRSPDVGSCYSDAALYLLDRTSFGPNPYLSDRTGRASPDRSILSTIT